jgi:hypothetical protein
VPGHTKDGHAVGRFHGITLEGLGVGLPRVRKGDSHLPDHTTGLAGDVRDWKDNACHTATDRQQQQPALCSATELNVPQTTRHTPGGLVLLINGEDHLVTLILGRHIPVASDTGGMIQQTRGHAHLLI